MVFPITLDQEWDTNPTIPLADETRQPITLKAIYEVRQTPEGAKQKVWNG
jgi:hypothetical protein